MKAFKLMTYYICILIFLSSVFFPIVYRFTHPEYTETQLFLKLWWLIFPLTISLIGINNIKTE